MRRSRTVFAFLATSAIVVGCSSGGGGGGSAAPSSEAPAASSPAASESAGASESASAGASAACNPPKQDGVTLSFTSFGGVYQEAQRKAWLTPYTELTGVQFTEDENSSNATIKSQVEAGQVTWDVVDVGNDFGLDVHKDLLEPLDFTLIPKDEMNADLGITDYRVPDITYGVVLAYNTDVLGAGKVPAGWADYFDTAKFPGKRGAWDYSEGGMFEFALMADGVAPKDLYTPTLDLERATKKLDTIKDDIVWWDSGTTSMQLLSNGECSMGMMWNGRLFDAIENQKLPFGYTWNGGLRTAAYYAVPKGAPETKTGMAAMAMWVLDRQGQIDFVNKTTYNTDIKDLTLDDYQANVRPYIAQGPNVAKTVTEDSQYYGKNLDAVSQELAEFQSQ